VEQTLAALTLASTVTSVIRAVVAQMIAAEAQVVITDFPLPRNRKRIFTELLV